MKIENFVKKVKEHTVPNTDVYFKMNALLGELGELSNIFKKMKFAEIWTKYSSRIKFEIENGFRQPFNIQMIDELGDSLFYFIQVINHYDIKLEDIMNFQSKKLDKQSEQDNRPYLK